MISLKNKKGFTLIELVIVLAIAALIILVVLQAVGAAQRSQRDNARKNKAAQVESYLTEYSSNAGNGTYPATLSGLFSASVLSSYDTNSSLTTYHFIAGPAYAATGWNPSAICTAPASKSTSAVTYLPYTANATNTDYDLAVCLEAGVDSVLKGN